MQIQSELLFVYGTLKDEGRLRSMLSGVSRWRIVGAASIQGRLYDLGPYPALALSSDPHDRVPGVLVSVESGDAALAHLDEYEDVSHGLYARQRVSVMLDASTTQDAWTYVYCRSLEGSERISEW